MWSDLLRSLILLTPDEEDNDQPKQWFNLSPMWQTNGLVGFSDRSPDDPSSCITENPGFSPQRG